MRRGARAAAETSQSLVEFALVLPIFLLLLFGLIDIGRFVYAANALNQAAREGARFGSVAGWSSDCRGSRDACIIDETRSRLAGVPGANVKVACRRSTAGTWSTAAPSSCRSNDLLKVTVEADFQILTPVIGQLIGKTALSGVAEVTVNQ